MAIFTAIGTAIGKIFVAGSFSTFLIKTVARVATSFLVQLLTRRKPNENYGVTGKMSVGEETPRQIPLGVAYTEGSLVYANEWGQGGGNSPTPNAYLTMVIALSDLPTKGLRRVKLNGAWVTLGAVAHPDYGFPVNEAAPDGVTVAWVKFYDGTQTAADPFLVNTVSSAEYPYQSTRVGYGVAYAICTAMYAPEFFSSLPTWGFEIEGARLYDISRDSTAGGSGPQRWNNAATWGGDGDDLPVVQAYNIMRGIYYGGQWLYGFQSMTAGRLPAAKWIEKVNACRATVTTPDGPEPRFRAGGMLAVNAECGGILQAVMAAAAGRIGEAGGVYTPIIGVPDAPVMSLTDQDLISSEPAGFFPSLGLADLINAAVFTYPEPAEGWAMKSAPPIYRADLEAKHDGRRLVASVSLTNVPFKNQVQRLAAIAIEEAQRGRRHALPLPPRFAVLEPNDVISWTSARHGYVNKHFRVVAMTLREDVLCMVEIQEVDPADYNFDLWPGYQPVTVRPTVNVTPPAFVIPGFAAIGVSLQDGSATPRRPAIRATWSPIALGLVRGISIEVRLSGDNSLVSRSTVIDTLAGEAIISDGILPSVGYIVRARALSESPTSPTPWVTVTTPATTLRSIDLSAAAASVVAGPDWTVRGSPLVLTPGAPAGNVFASAVAGQFPQALGREATVGLELTLVAGGPRMIRVSEGAVVKSRTIDQVVLVAPGTTRIFAIGRTFDIPPGGVSILSFNVNAQALDLASGESFTVTEFMARRAYAVR